MPGRPTPTIPDGGLFSAFGEVKVNASPKIVYDAIVDTTQWPKWGTFVPQVDISSQPPEHKDSTNLTIGAVITLHVHMTSSFKTLSKEKVNILEGPPDESAPAGTVYRIDWINESNPLVPRFMLAAERVNEIEVVGDGTCLYRTWETFSGPYARMVKWSLEGTLSDRFADWVKDLKKYCEDVATGVKDDGESQQAESSGA